MPDGSGFSVPAPASDPSCAFCNPGELAYVLHETPHFRLAADHAPLVEGHLLIIPKAHYACYGEVPAALDEELFALKQLTRQFFTQFYDPPVFWEHGIFRQTVFHAHLHCFPWGNVEYDLEGGVHAQIVTSQDDVRRWYAGQGQYFYLEGSSLALLFPPEMERYLHIIKSVFLRGITLRGGNTGLRPPEQRIAEGRPLIQAVAAKWQQFQTQGASYANETGAR
jgi:diadenosine tetraphosphate (Ap4A) HIT family hydrolase